MTPAFILLLLLTWPNPAHAYIDPGTGMLAIQGLIALIIGVIAFVKNPIGSIQSLLRRLRGKNDDDT